MRAYVVLLIRRAFVDDEMRNQAFPGYSEKVGAGKVCANIVRSNIQKRGGVFVCARAFQIPRVTVKVLRYTNTDGLARCDLGGSQAFEIPGMVRRMII